MITTLRHRGWALAALVTLLTPGLASAQIEEEEDGDDARTQVDERRRSLAERIPSVSGRAFSKEGRVEINPEIGLAVNDPFFNHLSLGATINYHILESLAVGVSGEYIVAIDTPVQVSGGGNPPRPNYNRPVYGARLQVSWAPIYGKLSLMAEEVLRFDTYIAAGAGVLGTNRTGASFAGFIAIGQHYFLNKWIGIRLELRDQLFSMARNPDQNSNKEFQTLLSATLGVSFWLPTETAPSSPTGPSS